MILPPTVDRCTLPLTGLHVVDRIIKTYDSVVAVTGAPVHDRE